MLQRKLALLLFIIASCATTVRGDMLINGYTNATNDRFTNSASFVASQFDLSGIGQNAIGQWATLISPNVVISADHSIPSGNIYFYADNDPSSTPVVRQIIDRMRLGNSDLWVGQLNVAVTREIRPFQFATQSLGVGGTGTLENAGAYQNVNAYMVGHSPANHPANLDQAIGRNRISGILNDVGFLGGQTDALILWNDAPNTADFVQYESRVVGGDSGAPGFVESNGQLTLLGINSFLLTEGNLEGSGISYTGNYSQQIQQFINAAAVPEPASIALFASAGTVALWRCRREFALGKTEYSPN